MQERFYCKDRRIPNIIKKNVYTYAIQNAEVEAIYDMVRKIEIQGQVNFLKNGSIELLLEGDPSMIKLIQHLVKRKVFNLTKTVSKKNQ